MNSLVTPIGKYQNLMIRGFSFKKIYIKFSSQFQEKMILLKNEQLEKEFPSFSKIDFKNLMIKNRLAFLDLT